MQPNQQRKIELSNEDTKITHEEWNRKVIEIWAKQQKEEIERSIEYYLIGLENGWETLTTEQKSIVEKWKRNHKFKELVKQHQETLENE